MNKCLEQNYFLSLDDKQRTGTLCAVSWPLYRQQQHTTKNALFIWICRSSAGRNAKAYVFLYYCHTVIIQLTDNNNSIFQQKRVDNVQNERLMAENRRHVYHYLH